MNKLNKIYEAMLKSWGCVIPEDGSIILNFSGTEVPVLVDEKQVFLPTSENLNGITIGKVFFHPACESIMSKETEIFKVIRKLTSSKIYSVFQSIASVLFAVAAKKSGKTLNGKTMEQLEPFREATKNVKQEVLDIIRTITITIDENGTDTRLINFSMIKGGKTENDEAIYYTATPSFPFYTELSRTIAQNEHLKPNDRLSFSGLSVSMQSMRTVSALIEIALPACLDPSRKKYSTTSQDAARMTAYLHSYGLVASDLNSLIGKFRKDFDAIGIYGIDLDWLSELDEIGEIKKLIPSLDYNNYNMTSAPEAPAANGAARISSYNPLHGLMNTSSNNTQVPQSTTANTPAQAPKIPDALPGENYIGCDYSPNNGIYEFKFQQSSGYIRVRRLSEDGRFISEDFQTPQVQQNGMMMNNGMMNNGMINPIQLAGMMQGMMGSGIPLLGMGNNNMNNGGWVRDPYTGQMVQAPQQQQQQQQNFGSPGYNYNNGMDLGGTVGINNF